MNDEKFLRAWQQARERGFWRFFLWRFLLLSVACAALVAWILLTSANPVSPGSFAAGFIVFAAIWATFIPFAWRKREARYRQLVTERARATFE